MTRRSKSFFEGVNIPCFIKETKGVVQKIEDKEAKNRKTNKQKRKEQKKEQNAAISWLTQIQRTQNYDKMVKVKYV
jgi:hypothetical protein